MTSCFVDTDRLSCACLSVWLFVTVRRVRFCDLFKVSVTTARVLILFTLFTRRACVTLDAKGRYTIKAANVADVVLEENSMVAEPRL